MAPRSALILALAFASSGVEAFIPNNPPSFSLSAWSPAFFSDTIGVCSSLTTIATTSTDDVLAMIPHQFLVTNHNQILADMLGIISHVILDFLTILEPDSIELRVFVLIGRVCDLLSSLISNHDSIFDKNQLILQLPLLYLSAEAVTNSFIKPFCTYRRKKDDALANFRDLKIFQKYIRSSDLSWFQFRLLQSYKAIQWIEMESNGDVKYCTSSEIILVYTGDLYVHEIDQIFTGDRGKSNKGFTFTDNSKNNVFLNLYLQKPSKSNTQGKPFQEGVQQDKKKFVSCIEARSDNLVLVKFDMQLLSSGILEADDLFQRKLDKLWIQILLQAKLKD